jgi:Fe-S cluster assembly protein SufD
MTQTTTPAPNPYRTTYERIKDEDGAPAWWAERRAAAMARFEATGLPSPRHEDWIYSSLRSLEAGGFHRARTPEKSTLEGAKLDLVDGPRLVFLDGRHLPESGSPMPEGVQAWPIRTLLREDPERLRKALALSPDLEGHAFHDLGDALREDGVLIEIAEGADIPTAVQIDFLTTSWQERGMTHPRVLVMAGARSALRLFERYEAQGPGTRFTNALTTVVLGEGARVRHTRLAREGAPAHHVGLTLVRQARDSHYAAVTVTTGSTLGRQEVQAHLDGPGATCDLSGLSVLGGREHADHHTVIHHHVPNCQSHELYKGIYGGQSRGAFTGCIVVAKDAQQTSSQQANHNLLISREATAHTRPQLEIHADDVQCAHGATIGQLDPEHMFYLRSRGLGPLEARNLLIHGFASEVLDRVEDEPTRAGLEQVLAARLNVDAS